MGDKVKLKTIQSGSAATDKLNSNFTAIEDGFNNTLSRDGTNPNAMNFVLDMNSNRIINLPAPVDDGDPVRLVDFNNFRGQGGTTAYALADLTNVSNTTFKNYAFPVGTGTSSYGLGAYLTRGACDPEDFGAVAGGTDATAAFQAALNTGRNIHIQKNKIYTIAGQLLINTTGQRIVGEDRWTSGLTFTYASGFQLTIGNDTNLVQNILFQHLFLYSHDAGNKFVFMRYVRGLQFDDCLIYADQFLELGDSTLDAVTRNAYIVTISNCELHQQGGTLSYIQCKNFAGQFVWWNSFLDGAGNNGTAISGVHGFTTKGNVRVRVDNVYFLGGIFHRFDINLNFEDGRVVNGLIDNMFLDESNTNAIRFGNSSSTTKAAANVGFEGFTISNCFVDALNGPSIYIHNARADANQGSMNRMSIRDMIVCGAQGRYTPLVIEHTAPAQVNPIWNITVDGITGYITPIDANQDWMQITGDTTHGQITDVKVNNLNGEFRGTAGRSVLRIVGSANVNISHGSNISAKNATVRVNDIAANTLRNGFFYGSDTHTYGAITAGSTGTEPVLCTGARIGDDVHVTMTAGTLVSGLRVSAQVTASDVVTISITNSTAGSITPGVLTFLVTVKPRDL